MQRCYRAAVTAAGAASLLAASLLAGPAMAATAASGPQPQTTLPLSARQILADRELHQRATTASGAITGSAEAADGQPLAGVCVLAYGPSGRKFSSTQPDGRYLLTGLKPGIYHVRYFGCGSATPQYLPQWYGGSAEQARARPVLVSPRTLQPLPPVTMQTAASQSPTADVIDPASQATISRSFQTALGLPAYGRGIRPAVTPAVAAAHGGQISGTVTSPSGHGLSGICVEVQSSTSPAGTLARTGKGGHYLTGRLPSGRYFVLFFADCGNTGDWIAEIYKHATLAKPTAVGVARGRTTTGINGQLEPGGEITGTITNGSGARLSGVCIDPVGSGQAGQLTSALVLGLTERGAYRLRGLPTGSYKLLLVPCTANSPYAAVWWPRALSERTAKSIRVTAGKVRAHINASMPLGAVISGTVTSQGNAPLQGICVTAFTGSGSPGITIIVGGVGLPPGYGVTNAAGQYTLIGLDPGSYHVQFSLGCNNNGNYLPATYPRKLKLTYGQTDSKISVQLLTGTTLAGTVTSAATGDPVKGICVYLLPGGTTNYFNPNQVTGGAGTYTFNQMPAGTYYVQFVPGCTNSGSYAPQGYDNSNVFLPQVISVKAAGETITGINAALQPGATITGTVTGPHGSKLSGMCVDAASPVNGVDNEVSSKNGTYSVPDLLPGQYELAFSPGCNNNADLGVVYYGSPSTPVVVSAPAGLTSGIDAVLPAAGSLSGEIRTKSGTAVALGCATVTGLNAATEADSGGGGLSGGNGKYEATNLVPGPYQVYFQPGCFTGSSYENQWYKDRSSPAGAARVEVRAGRTAAGITSALIRGGSIAGRVTTSSGKPVNGACVFAQSVSQPDDYGNAQTNKAGRYVVEGLNSGAYELEFFPCDEGAGTLAEQLLSRTVQVTAPHTTAGANTTLPLAGSVSGTVLGSTVVDGTPTVEPQPGMCVDAFQINGFGANAGGTQANGTFTITNLPAGKYVVYIGDTSCGGIYSDLAPVYYENAPTVATATVISVDPAKVTALASDTLPSNGAISGTVTGPGSTPVAGICVTATSALSPQPVEAVTGAGGTYTLVGLAPSRYRLKFSSGCGALGYLTQWWNDKMSASTANTVPVAAAATTSAINASLQK
jgi:molybdopterin-binding protein